MSRDLETSDDGQEGAEAFEQSDEAFDESTNLDAGFLEAVEQDPSLDPVNQIDSRELEEIDGQLDDPEEKVTLSDGSDDPDGLGGPPPSAKGAHDDAEGWDLDEPLA